MFKNKLPKDMEINPPTLLTASIFLSSTLTIFLYMLLSLIINFDNPLAKNVFIISLIVSGVLLTLVFLLLGILFSKFNKNKAYVTELKNFKDFTDALHSVSEEIDVYELLYEFIRRMPLISQTTLFYRSDFFQESEEWKEITDRILPLCKFSTKHCPLIQYGRECYVDNIRDNVRCSYQLPDFKTGSYVCLPILNSGYRQCILQLYSLHEYYFDAITISKIKSYIEIAKVVINSGRTVQLLNQKVSTDKLTKLYNRAFIDTYLDKQIDISRFSYKQLSLITGDIDFFKGINDTYGHAAGDYILVQFAQILLHCTRKSDIVARYGGDEFLIVLPNTDKHTAFQIADRIVKSVSETKISPFDGKEIKQITCSLGLSTFPDFCDNKEALMKTADIALYKSKQAGRNCASIYNPV